MKKRLLVPAVLLILAAMLTGCGMILVEDSEPVRIGADMSGNINRNMSKKT